MPQEIELKLAFPAYARDKVLTYLQTSGGVRLKPAQTLVNTYYDTPELALGNARVALRTRKVGDKWLQTVKCAATSVGGLSSRPEWEQTYSGEFDFSAVAEMPRALLEQHRAAIVPLFSTNFCRDTFLLEPSPGVRIQAMVDLGTVEAAGRQEDICELELELETGSAADLWALAIMLAHELPLLPFDPSKAARGYRLFCGESEKPARAQASCVDKSQAPREAFLALANQILHDWQANIWGVLTQADPEFVHQLRIALRRLRCLLQFFASILPGNFVQTWLAELAETADATSVSRDLSVIQMHVLGPLQTDSPDQSLPSLQSHCEQAAQAAHHSMRELLWQKRCGEQLLRFAQALHELPEMPLRLTLVCLVRSCLREQRKQARKTFEAARQGFSCQDFHRLRIRLKRLRYGLEFFSPLLSGKKSLAVYQKKLTLLQEGLGRINDLDQATRTAQEWALSRSCLSEGAAYLRGWSGAWIAGRHTSLLKKSARFLRVAAPWCKLAKEACEKMDRNDGDC